ncbi:polysaccharide/chitin/xylan deacetylase [Mangrovactinospora gilvigrisea]|uniref:Polysaccharide/chitin/xylan deacetylase n=1 Tax=Mangrovactinospora gilvigrisea TaxID=1428644 RepID=A0A1J7BKY9_9ACTN|nr:polysaccharide deacetylase family protein [Mangrovactinospora gilvigrisea]OIV39245.1 polysaccharide/chitin/xylan deacetylase [Mangrovactinospora gilvigrisea]
MRGRHRYIAGMVRARRAWTAGLVALAAGIITVALLPGPGQKAPGAQVAAAGRPTAPADGAPAAGGAAPGSAAAFRAWHLDPLPPAPPAPTTRPVVLGAGIPPAISRVPTTDKVVFVTIDDGAVKDPEFVRMMGDLRIPFTMFLTDGVIRGDYGYFAKLKQLGGRIENHTMTHADLPHVPDDRQRAEICDEQQKLSQVYGVRPELMRPPYGAYDDGTKRTAQQCGIKALVLWRETMQIQSLRYQRSDDRLHPGDIVLAHFRGPRELKGRTMTQMMASLLREIGRQGFAVARLEDYV